MSKSILRKIVLCGLFIIPFVSFLVSGSFFFPFITTKAFVFRIVVEVIFGAWILLVLFVPEYRPKKSVLSYALLVFVILIGLADVLGVAPAKSFWSNFERMEGYITILHLGAMFLVMSTVLQVREWKWWWNTTLVASVIMALYCFLQLLGSININQGGVRVDGTFGNAAYLAVYMLFHIFIAALFMLREKTSKSLKWSYGIIIFLNTIVLYYTATRGAILGLIGGIFLIALLNIRNKDSIKIRKVSVGVIGGLLLLVGGFLSVRHTSFVASSPVLSRFSSLNVSEIKTEGRSYVWPMAIQGIKEKPFLGWGQENFNYVFNKHYNPNMFRLEPWFDRAHNIFLDWGVSAGLLGLLSYLSLYVALLYLVWKKSSLPHFDKSLLTGLVAAYFFHNLFVFDHLVSYILFWSLLAYIHTTVTASIVRKEQEESSIVSALSPFILIFILGIIYFVNIRPMVGNMALIDGLRAAQVEGGDKEAVLGYFKKAYNASRLGRPEVVEWIAPMSANVLGSAIPTESKNNYFYFAKDVVTKQVANYPTDTRYRLLASSFFTQTGFPDEALMHLREAEKLTPGKQTVYFGLGQTLLVKQDTAGALAAFKKAYDLAPEYKEARIIYLVGAMYANDSALAETLLTSLTFDDVAFDSRVISALMSTGRFTDLGSLMQERIKRNPSDQEAYLTLANAFIKAGNRTQAVNVLRALEVAIPSTKNQIEGYIKGIQDGTIK